ncbi:MAG: DUF4435 domain-containing protein [Armatimonadota bacterium]
MSDFTRTEKGLSNLPYMFYDQIFVWVEGDEDEEFWGVIFEGVDLRQEPHFHAAGGIKVLREDIAPLIVSGSTEALMVMDGEYGAVIPDEQIPKHPRILRTERHSIENYLLTEDALAQIIKRRSWCEHETAAEWAREWKETIETYFEELLYYDCTAIRLGTGDRVMGREGAKFRPQNSDWPPSLSKIKRKIAEVDLPNEELERTREAFADKCILHLIRGHFLTHFFYAVIRLAHKDVGMPCHMHRDDVFRHAIEAARKRLTNNTDAALRQLVELVEKALDDYYSNCVN